MKRKVGFDRGMGQKSTKDHPLGFLELYWWVAFIWIERKEGGEGPAQRKNLRDLINSWVIPRERMGRILK